MKIGFIGCGNMASAIMGGIIDKGIFDKKDVYGYDVSEAAAAKAKDSFGSNLCASYGSLIEAVDIIVLAVKPQYYEEVIASIRSDVSEQQIIITIAPGKTLEWVKEKFGKELKIVRTMPNTPAQVGAGMTALCMNELVTDEEMDFVKDIFGGIGACEVIDESLMDAVVAVSGSSPAYVFMMIEAMADAAVMGGMPRKQAYTFASQAVAGSAQMVLETGIHPGELKDMVCSPKGTTIEAVRVLEEKGFRSALIESMQACMDKASKM